MISAFAASIGLKKSKHISFVLVRRLHTACYRKRLIYIVLFLRKIAIFVQILRNLIFKVVYVLIADKRSTRKINL